jgi:hypothetical protein
MLAIVMIMSLRKARSETVARSKVGRLRPPVHPLITLHNGFDIFFRELLMIVSFRSQHNIYDTPVNILT